MRMLVATTLAGAILMPLGAMAASPFEGTWKEDPSTSKSSNAPDRMVLKDGMYSCKSCAPSYTVKADGSDQPVSGNPYYDTVAVSASDPHKVVVTEKKSGKAMETLTFDVAQDGKTVSVDFSGTAQNGAAFSGQGNLKRIAAGPKGSEPISGSWQRTGLSNASDNIMTVTYKVNGDMLTMTDPTGDSYSAKMDGASAPEKGNPGVTEVSVKTMGSNTLMETDMRDGKTVETVKSTVAPDGNSMTVVDDNKMTHRTTTYKANKQ